MTKIYSIKSEYYTIHMQTKQVKYIEKSLRGEYKQLLDLK